MQELEVVDVMEVCEDLPTAFTALLPIAHRLGFLGGCLCGRVVKMMK
jgi:hypothetical protein